MVPLALLAPVAALSAPSPAPPLEAAVVVAKGYHLDVMTQEFEYEWDQWTLFRDGTVFEGLPPGAVPDFDVAKSRTTDPKRWGTWKKTGETLQVAWTAGDWESFEKWFPLVVAEAGEKLDGTWSRASTAKETGVTSDFFASGWQVISFRPDGTFSLDRGGAVSASGMVAASKSSGGGTYQLDGALLVLTYADGHTTRGSLFFADADRRSLFLNGARFRRG